jgi:hypothetical protein
LTVRLKIAALMILYSLGVATSTARAGDVVFGIKDDNARWTWPAFAVQVASLQPIQVGVALRTDCHGSVPDLGLIPPTQPVFATLVGPGAKDSPCLADAGIAAYAQAARRLVLRNPNIRELQVWNEEDLCWWPCFGAERTPRFQGWFLDRYLDLLAATHDALEGTGVKVLGFGMSPRINDKWSPDALAAAIVAWYAARSWTRPIMDGFSWHPYCGYGNSITRQIVSAFNRAWDPRSIDGWREGQHFPQPSPARGLKIWWTETGLDTGSVEGEYGYVGIEGGITACGHGTEKAQARRVAEVAKLARANRYIGAAFNFLLNDEPDLRFWQSGLVRPDGSLKPAFGAFRRAIR